ncbi:MAG: TetR/AcrR family transcriptional regulator [Solirubrobacteraceae bacterium]
MSDPRHSVKGAAANRWADTLDEHRTVQRDHILTVAFELLKERGMTTMSMSAVAARAGISRATLYHYFPDMDALLSAWVGREIGASVTEMVRSARAIPDPLARIEQIVTAQTSIFSSSDHRLSAEHFESEAGSPTVRSEVANQMAPLRELLAETLDEAHAAGLLRAELEPRLAADLVLGMLGAARRHIVAGNVSAQTAAAAVIGLVRRGWFAA